MIIRGRFDAVMERYRGIVPEGNRRNRAGAENSHTPLLRFQKGFPVSSKLTPILVDTEISLSEDADLNEFGMTIDANSVRLGRVRFDSFLQNDDPIGIRGGGRLGYWGEGFGWHNKIPVARPAHLSIGLLLKPRKP